MTRRVVEPTVISHSKKVGPYQVLAESILRFYVSDKDTVTDTDRLLTGILATQLALIDLLEEAITHLEERGI